MFSVNFGHSCEISKNTFFHRTPLVAAFVPQLLSCEFEDYSKENILNEMRLLKHFKEYFMEFPKNYREHSFSIVLKCLDTSKT